MKTFVFNLTCTLVALLIAPAVADEPDYLKAFPKAEKGMAKYVIQLPHKERGEEDDFRVEIIVGKNAMTDGVNLVRLGGEIQPRPLKGWGFTYYEVKKFGPMASTLMAPRPGAPQVEKFVTLPPKLIRYNSRVPVVVYVPEDGEVRYRIWRASEETEMADKH